MNVDHFPMGSHHWFSTNLCESTRPEWVTKGRNPTASPQSQTKNDAWRRRGAVQLTFEGNSPPGFVTISGQCVIFTSMYIYIYITSFSVCSCV